MIWAILNIVASVVVAMIIVYKLAAYHDWFNRAELAGMGLIGSSMMLRCGPLLATKMFHQVSPFDDWSTLVMNIGLALYFVGRMSQHWKGIHRHG